MTWLQVLWALLQVVIPIIKQIMEKNNVKRKEQQEALDQVMTGIKNGDASAVNAGLSTLNRRLRA